MEEEPEQQRESGEPDGSGGAEGTGRWIVVAFILTVVLAAAVGFAAGRLGVFGGEDASSSAPSTSSTALPPPATLVSHRDPNGNYTIGYPKGWKLVRLPDDDALFLVSPNREATVSVKVGEPVPQEQLSAELATLGVKDSYQEAINVNGAGGVYFVYPFTEEGKEGLALHYFLYTGSKMHTLLLQALPAERLGSLTTVFNQILRSYQPAGVGTTATTTTSP